MTPPVQGADFLAALVASALLGAFPPVDFLAVCFVRAMLCFHGLCQSSFIISLYSQMAAAGQQGPMVTAGADGD